MSTPSSVPGLPGWLFAYCLLNLLFFLSVQPYRIAGDELLANGDFSRGLEAWEVSGDRESVSLSDGLLTLTHLAVTSTTLAQCWQALGLPQSLLLSAEARTDGVKRGEKSWHTARIDLVGYDATGQGQYRVGTRLLNLDDNQPWTSHQALFEPRPDAQRVCLEISLYHAPGRFQVQRLSLVPGAESLYFHVGRSVLAFGWVVLVLVLGRSLYRHYRGHPLAPWLLLAVGSVLFGVLMPHELRSQVEQGLLGMLGAIGLPMPTGQALNVAPVWALWPEQWDLSKLGHLLGFALLGLLLTIDRRLTPLTTLGLLLVWALATEVLQFFVPQRTPRLSDLTVDLLGILAGMSLTVLWFSLRSCLPRRMKGKRA